MKMKNVKRNIVMVVASSLLFISFSAGAAECTRGEALTAIETLSNEIATSTSFLGRGGGRAQDGLEAKAISAQGKVGVKKYDGALQKLEDIILKIDDYATAPKAKLLEDEADILNGLALSAMDCVAEL
jgi:hypothetical protein